MLSLSNSYSILVVKESYFLDLKTTISSGNAKKFGSLGFVAQIEFCAAFKNITAGFLALTSETPC